MNSAGHVANEKQRLAALIEAIKLNDYGLALGGLKDFLVAYPHHEVAMGLLAAAYFQMGIRDRAATLYEQLVAIYPHNALARFQLGLLRQFHDPRAALVLWAPLLEIEGDFMAHFHSALSHLQLDEKVAAVPLLDRAAKHMSPGHPLRGELERLRRTLSGSASESRQ